MNSLIFLFSSLRPLLSPSDQRKSLRIIFLLLLNSLLDFFNLASFLPLIYVVSHPDFAQSGGALHRVYVASGCSSTTTFVGLLTAGVVVFAILKNLVSRWILQQKARFAFRVGSDVSARALSRFMEASYLQFTRADFSGELDKVANQPIAFANNILMPAGTLLSEGILLLLLLTGVGLYNTTVFLFLTIVVLPLILLVAGLRRGARKISADLKDQYPRSLKYALQAIEGSVEIKALGKESYFKDRFAEVSRKLSKTFARDHVAQTGVSRLTETAAVYILGFLVLFAIRTHQNFQETIVLLGVYAAVSFRMIPSLNRVLTSLQQIKSHEYLFANLSPFRSAPVPGKPKTKRPVVTFMHNLELRNLTFQYPDSTFALHDVSLMINKGDTICITGKSGSGKTTMLLILLGLLDEYTGSFLLDGKLCIPGESPGRKSIFGYVPQNPSILDGTLRENIAFGIPSDESDTEKIMELIRKLDLTDLLHQLSDGLESRVGEKGIRLSGGQRQRIAIARVLYAEAEVLLLDEITNHLDPKTETALMNTLIKLSGAGKTLVFITHRTDLQRWFGRIVELQDGLLHESRKKT